MLVIALSLAGAQAAEVVWFEAPSDADRVRVARVAGATGPVLGPMDLRAAATRWTDADDLALRNVDAALEAARAYETQLDGELLILRDVEPTVAGVGALRNQADRGRLFAALAYQGFAVNRYWGDGLADDAEAEPWRVEVNGRIVERPWLDAIALEPEREVTPYEIAEAPQRVAYGGVMTHVAGALPASLTPVDLPAGSALFVDGRSTTPGPSGNVKVVPGRHLAHVEVDGRIIDRWDVRVQSGGDARLEPAVSAAQWSAFVDALGPGATVPDAISTLMDAVGGDVWFALPTATDPLVLRVSGSTLEQVELPREDIGEEAASGSSVELAAGVLGGWLSSGDFYNQDPTTENSRATVNAASAGGYVSADVRVSLLRAGVGLDVLVPLGQDHVALTGDSSMRVRPIPHLAAGLPWAQATVGYLFPYHPAVGARARLPLGPLEVRGVGWLGMGTTRDRADGTPPWEGLPVYTLSAGVGASLR